MAFPGYSNRILPGRYPLVSDAKTSRSFLKLIFGSFWLALFLFALLSWSLSSISLSEVPHLLHHYLSQVGIYNAALLYIIIYAVRPLILFPATLLTIASGLLFGPWLGTLFTIIGENASANFGILLSRWFARASIEKHSSSFMRHWDQRLHDNGLTSVMTMRLIMLPFDAVNFGCGLSAIRHRDYAIGTFIGILPSLIGFVLLGGIVSPGEESRFLVLILSALFMFLGFSIAHFLKKREALTIDNTRR